jgi:hypothetical protein
MANPSYKITLPDIEQGPAQVWIVPCPASNNLMLVDSSGQPVIPANNWANNTAYNQDTDIITTTGGYIMRVVTPGTSNNNTEPSWNNTYGSITTDGSIQWQNMGAPTGFGATDGACTIHIEPKIEEVVADQETAPIDALHTAELAYFEFTFKEAQIQKLAQSLAHPTFTTGNDSGLPSGNNKYDAISVGGLTRIPSRCLAVVSPRRYYPGCFLVATLYKAIAKTPLSWLVTRTKEHLFKVRFDGLAELNRAAGDRVAKVYKTRPV